VTSPAQPTQPPVGHDLSGGYADPAGSSPEPPPGCPAHALGPGGLRRLFGPEADADLPGLYEKLRAEHGNVAPVLIHGDIRIWAVLGHTENLRMVSSPALFNRDPRTWTAMKNGEVKPDNPLAPVLSYQPMCSFTEGAEHMRLRSAVSAATATIHVRDLHDSINRGTQRIINRFCERGSCDAVDEFCEHLPMMVMLDLLGAPELYSERFVQAARDLIKGSATAIASNEFIMGHLMDLAVRFRADPSAGNLTSTLIAHPSALTDEEVAHHLRLLLIAAYEGTANLLANLLRVVLTDPGFRAQLSGGQMTVSQAVEQSLWDEPPFSAMIGYFAKVDTELGGRQIRAGDGLIMGIQPGNQDPAARPEPGWDMLGNRAHLAFGAGPHGCPGHNIGRAVAELGVDAFLLRLPDTRLAVAEDKLRWTSTILSRHLVELPVAFTPQEPQDESAKPARVQKPEPPAEDPGEHTALRVPPQPGPVPPQATPRVPPPPVPPVPQGRRYGLWQRFLLWWRGY
jgi:cytochrome P450